MAETNASYVKSENKAAVDKIVDQVASAAISGLPTSAEQVAINTANNLVSGGVSVEAVAALSSLAVDNIVNKGSTDYFAFAARSPGRVSQTDLTRNRNVTADRLYFSSVDPVSKTRKSRRNEAVYESLLI